ncbi:MAG: glutaredoxin domain-containing protein [Candidatus Micrarchaeaceae archaeon]
MSFFTDVKKHNFKEEKFSSYWHIIGFNFALIGFIYTILEFLLLTNNSSICYSQGCKLAGHFASIGESSLVLAGSFYFILLAVAIYERFASKFLLTIGLIAEGYFLSFQLFVMHTICYFCLGVFIIILIISLCQLLDKRFPIRNYFYFLTVLAAVFLVHAPYADFSQNGNYLLYSPTCPHCHQTINYLQKQNVPVKLANADKYQAFLNSFGINQIPCLIVKNNDQTRIIVGENNIENYFSNIKQETSGNYFSQSYDSYVNNQHNQTCVIGKVDCK